MDYDRGQRVSTLALNWSLPNVLPLIDIVEAYYQSNSVDYRFLAKVVGTYVCNAMQLTFGGPNLGIYQPQCPTLDSIVWMGAPGYIQSSHVLCASFGNTSFFVDANAMIISEAMPQLLYGGASNIAKQMFGLNLYFDPYGGQSVRDSSKFDVLSASGFGIAAESGLEASGSYAWLSLTAMPCGNVDQFSCAENMLFELIRTNRSCTSLMQFGAISYSTLPCTTRYSLVGLDEPINPASPNVWKSILAGCPRQCEYTRYVAMICPVGVSPSNRTLLNVYPQPVLFLAYTEYFLMDFVGFLGAFGGLIGWWLGGSLVVIVHIVIFVSKAMASRLIRAAKSSSEVGGTAWRIFDITIIKYCREFSFITDFHGFPFLAKETNVLAALVWLLVLPLCFAFTMQEIVVLISQYASQPIETDMIIQRNATTAFDDAAICLAIYRDQLFERNGSVSIIDFNQTLQNFIASGQLNLLHTFISQNETLDTSLATLNERVMLTSYMMMNAFTDYDQEAPWSTGMAYNQTTLDQVDMLTNVLIGSNVNFFQLTKLIAAYTCDVIYQTRIAFHQFDPFTSTFQKTMFNPCHDLSKFTRISADPVCTSAQYCNPVDVLCVNLPTNITTFKAPQDYVSAQIVNDDSSVVFIAFDLRHGLGAFDPANFDGGLLALGIGQTVSGGVVILSESRQWNTSSASCSSQIQLDCAFECFFANVSARRSCWSLSDLGLAKKPPAMQPCLQHYSFAEAATTSTSLRSMTLSDCRSKACLPACVSRSYFYYTSSISMTASKARQLDIHQGNAFLYAVYETKLLMYTTDLCSGIGAILGLWIGGSIIAIIHIPVFAISALFVHFCSKTDRENKLDSPLTQRNGFTTFQENDVVFI